MTKGKYTKGFTLVELLVVIAIIAILSGALFLVINPANLMMKARDSRRISEITEVAKVVAAAFADSKIAVPTAAVTVRSTCTAGILYTVNGTGWVGGWPAGGSLSAFMNVLPRDPTNVTPLCYSFAMNTLGNYEINARFESVDNVYMMNNDGGNASSTTTCLPAGCVAGAAGCVCTVNDTTARYEVGTLLTLI